MSIHVRRALAEAEAAAWLDLHSDWSSGLPADVRDTTVRGQLFHDCAGDGWDTLWWQSTASDLDAPAARTTSTTPRCAVDSDYEQSMPTIERHRAFTGRLGDYGIEPTAPSSVVARAGTEHLLPVTVVLGDRVPGGLTFDQRTVGRGDRCATFATDDMSFHADTTWMQQLAYDELVSWLRLEAGCTDLEVDALERRAARVAQRDASGQTLARAQRRARAALAQS